MTFHFGRDEEMAWADYASCKGQTQLFFTEHLRQPARERAERRAQSICSACKVSRECLEHAILRGEFGTWGGYTEVERRGMKPVVLTQRLMRPVIAAAAVESSHAV